MNKDRPIDRFVSRSGTILQSEYIVIGKQRVSSLTAWLIIAFFIGITVAIAFLASNSGALQGSLAAIGGPATYQASTDFVTYAGTQSQGLSDPNRWSYLDGVSGTALVYSSSSPDCGNQPCFQGKEQYLIVARDWLHPGNNSYPIRRWTANQTGLAYITSTGLPNVHDNNITCGDGVNVTIKKNGVTLWSQYLANGNAAGFSFDLAPQQVIAGDTIDFIVDKAIVDNWCDATFFDAKIQFVPGAAIGIQSSSITSYQASRGFAASQGPIWFYRDSNNNPLVYQPSISQWQGNEQYLLLWPDGGHPGNGADAMRVFKAPFAGNVHIYGQAKAFNSGGDGGVVASIKKAGTTLWSQAMSYGTGYSFDIPSLPISTGDEIQFIINKGPTNNYYDSTFFNPTVEYQSLDLSYQTTGPGPYTSLIYTQPVISNIDDAVLAQPAIPPDNKTVIILWDQGLDVAKKAISWAVGRYTGFYPPSPVSSYQRGINNSKSGTTAVQASGSTVGLLNNPPSVPLTGNLAPIVFQQSFPPYQGPRPWLHPASELHFGLDLQVPNAFVKNGAVGYVQASLALHTTATSTKPFWVQVSAYDTRGSFTEFVQGDDCTNCTGLAIIGSAFASSTQYLHVTSSSSLATGKSWSGFRHFEFVISRNELSKAIAAVKNKFPLAYANLSDRPEDYEILLVGVLNEIYFPAGSDARLGSSMQNMKIFEMY